MLMWLHTLNWIISITLLFSKHPLSIGFMLIIQTIIVSLTSGFFYFNFWFSYILFLVMISGMLIMFIYMTSVASNEKFFMVKSKMLILGVLFSTMVLSLALLSDKFYSNLAQASLEFSELSDLNLNSSLNKFFNPPFTQISILIMIFLLLTLIIVVKMTDKPFGPLRQK
uniref:NADH-ubiquinone oxidoreductase chain 6 n=1 Tax=Polygraphus poligraphus TaxID=516982 RepID=A0A8F5A2I3_9CUCU|nr:NADH dehydrogenase subunit 6 [Polygraphus poligraphus]QXG82901.1 NADH dehydrogenase subunit 6 [Polygraphus poligraphus]UJX85658.1 NADH dehydrogenase subunit 6 [Polygraphus poligraphus]